MDGEENDSPGWLADPCMSVEEIIERRDLKVLLMKCLFELPVEQRMTVLMVDVYDFDYKEAAGVLRVPVGTVKSRLARSRLLLRNLFERLTDLDISEWS